MNLQPSTKTSATRDEQRVVVPFQNSAPVAEINKFVFISFIGGSKNLHFEKTNPFPPSIYGLF